MEITHVGVSNLSGLTIDTDKDWGGHGITNFSALHLVSGGHIRIEDTLANNLEWSGIVFSGTAGENLTQFQTVYRKADSKYWLAKANVITTMPVMAIAAEAIAANATGLFLLFGWARNDAWTLVVGGSIYQSEITAGLGSTTQPSTSGNIIQKVGIAITVHIAHFMPIYSTFEVT